MMTSAFSKLTGYFRTANQWFFGTAERALDQAYDAALMIKAIEDEYFEGSKIAPDTSRYSSNVFAYFQTELRKYLTLAKVRLTEFKASGSILGVANASTVGLERSRLNAEDAETQERATIILEKLKFIDEILDRYAPEKAIPDSTTLAQPPSASLVVVPQQEGLVESPGLPKRRNPRSPAQLNSIQSALDPTHKDLITDVETITDKTGVLPRSILGTINRIKRELKPQAEEQVVRDFRSSKAKTVISLRFILLLILIPLLTQQISKNFLVGPIVDRVRNESEAAIFINYEMEERALLELHTFEERLRFEQLIGLTPPLPEEQVETAIRQRAIQIANEYRGRSSSAVKNVFADLLSLVSFGIVIFFSKREIEILKSFIDEIVYGLSDSAKAFIIILFTDVFVGFHSPHGWEVILEGLSRHLGLPENREFIFIFIATFPVILDTIFKYWIFRYLNRISPSAVATYRNMNE